MKKVLFLLVFFLFFPTSYSNPASRKKKEPISATKKVAKNYRLSKKSLSNLQKSLTILTHKPVLSRDYIKTVTFLENNVYNQAHFSTLDLLADTYKTNGDHLNQIKVLNILVSSYPKNPKSHYKLGMAYKSLFLKNYKAEDKEKAIDNLSNSIKTNRKYEPAYKELLPLFLNEDSHTKNSLLLVMEMIRYVKKPKYYIYLCEAYFDNKYFKQGQKACKKAMNKNPKDLKSKILYVLSQEPSKNRNKKITNLGNKYKKSFYVQFKTGLFFMKTNPTLATSYFKSALKINPESLKLLKIISKLLFSQGQYKESYYHFSKACTLSRGAFMLEFQKASSQIAFKNKKIHSLFKKGIDKCFNFVKKSKKN